ncbi:hypothetical protein ASD11_10405 [Aeromicrobium sp. Root495]|uniref:alpha/beta fold hydrolase n=1 Tax=Aeromicrobium sp. Root495 TaxID=1736550 RepID=UPI0006F4672F|nr:alpha/beta hydrolase [Aeromicrobium sp. Root495]KQY59912.1 hypothetical protein ASD11_10405 [Aeromicrobium sp. Root495]
MSTPTTLALPDGVVPTAVDTSRGSFAAHTVRVAEPRGHVLLVPGWTGSKEDMTQVLPLLAAAGLDATAYDQRGQHETPGTDHDDYSLHGFGADAVAVGRAVSSTPAHLLGHSFGGLVAQWAVLADPSAWRTLSLLCTGPGALGDSPVRPLVRMVEAFDEDRPMLEIHEARQGDALGAYPPGIEAFLAERFTNNARASIRAITQLLVDAPDRVDAVASVGLPTWVARGERDDAWPHDEQDRMAQRLGTSVVLLDAAHSPGVENPEGLAEAWLPFLVSH